MQRNYWVVRLGSGNAYADVCHKRNIIAIGWDELDLDLSQFAELGQREFAQTVGNKLAKAIPDKSDKYAYGSARQLFKFAVLMKPGDVVISPANSEGLKYFGIVRGPYEYAPADPELPFRHRREVEWVAEIDKESFTDALRNSSGSIMTVFSVSPHAEEIDRLLAGKATIAPGMTTESIEEFGMESHLEDFLVENWEKIPAFKGYEIYEEDGEVVGQQYSTNVGRIDILARSKDKKEWLVIELKKGMTSDNVVGQTLRYIGWVKKHEAEESQAVRGLIITGDKDEKLMYALETLDNVGLMTYVVSFDLKNVK